MSKNPDWLGHEIAGGRYRVEAKLGEGGMGTVYRAWDHHLEDKVVLKVPHVGAMLNENFIRRFEQEVRALVRLQHPHVVRVIDVGKHQGLPYAVMQFLAGGSLRDRIPRGANGQPLPMPFDSLSTWLPQVAAAVDFIHAQGFIHRDIKPANILFDGYGHAFLGDFGLAKALAALAMTPISGMTQQGIVLGTPDYMAPEVIAGSPYDGKADQFALAVTVYELLTAHSPFTGLALRAILLKQQGQDLPPPHELNSTLPPALARPLRQAMATIPAARHATCTAFASAALAVVRRKATVISSGAPDYLPHTAACEPAPSPPSTVTHLQPTPPPAPAVSAAGPPHQPPSSIQQHCPSCQKLLRFPLQAQGRRVPCPLCKKPLMVGESPAAPPADSRTLVEVAAPVGRPMPSAQDLLLSSGPGYEQVRSSAQRRGRSRLPWILLGGSLAIVVVPTAISLALVWHLMEQRDQQNPDPDKVEQLTPAGEERSADVSAAPATKLPNTTPSPAANGSLRASEPGPAGQAPKPAAPPSPTQGSNPMGIAPLPMPPMAPPGTNSGPPMTPGLPPSPPANPAQAKQVFSLPVFTPDQQATVDLKTTGARPFTLAVRGLDPQRQGFQEKDNLLKVTVERSGGVAVDLASFQAKDGKLVFTWANAVSDPTGLAAARKLRDCVLEIKPSEGASTLLALRPVDVLKPLLFQQPVISTERTEFPLESMKVAWPNPPACPLFLELGTQHRPSLRNGGSEVPLQTVSVGESQFECTFDPARNLAMASKAANYRFAKVLLPRAVSTRDGKLTATLIMARENKMPPPNELADERAALLDEGKKRELEFNQEVARARLTRDNKRLNELLEKRKEQEQKLKDLDSKLKLWQQDKLDLQKNVRPTLTLTAGTVWMDVEGVRVEVYRFEGK